MSGMEKRLLDKLVAIDRATHEVLDEQKRGELAVHSEWLAFSLDEENYFDPTKGTIWEGR